MALKKKKENKEREVHQMTVKRAYEFDNGNVAFDLEIDGWLTIYNMTMVHNKNDEYFVSFPSTKTRMAIIGHMLILRSWKQNRT